MKSKWKYLKNHFQNNNKIQNKKFHYYKCNYRKKKNQEKLKMHKTNKLLKK